MQWTVEMLRGEIAAMLVRLEDGRVGDVADMCRLIVDEDEIELARKEMWEDSLWESPYSAIMYPVMVTLEDIDEGYSGEYNPDDPADEKLLRFTIWKFSPQYHEWEPVESASYCTHLPTTLEEDKVELVISFILSQVYDYVREGESVKRIAAELSWLSSKDILSSNEIEHPIGFQVWRREEDGTWAEVV